MIRPLQRLWHPTIPIMVALVVVWWFGPAVAHVPDYIFPSLAETARTLVADLLNGTLELQALASIGRYLVGVGLGAGLGITVGILLASNRAVAESLEPIVEFVRAIAGIAWLPLAVIWLGIGNAPLLFVIVNIVFFILVTNTMHGVQSVPRVLRDMIRTLGAPRIAIYRDVILPGALPSILVGVRLAVGFGWQAAIAGEVLYGQSGLGFMAQDAGSRFDSASLVVALMAIGFLGLLITQFALAPIEASTIERWGTVRSQ